MESLSLLIKPASGNCQLRCKYCFYEDITNNRQIGSYGFMSDETLKLLVKNALNEADSLCSFAFQGGEPTLIGLDFYKKLISFQKDFNKKDIKIQNSIQTNGIVLDDTWCQFFTENNFLVGISLDGSKDIHDKNRVDANDKGTFNRVMKSIALLEKHKTQYNILFVVTNELARRANHVYKFFRERDFKYLQFIPCIDDFDKPHASNPFSLTPERYSHFLKTFFDLWYEDFIAGHYISVRHFDNWVNILMQRPPDSCSMIGRCTCYGVVEADGGVYPCDFYVLDKWKLGNIHDNTFAQMLDGQKSKDFVSDSMQIPEKCQKCQYYFLCRNGCRRDREHFGEPENNINNYCSSFMDFFPYSIDRMTKIARTIR